MGHSLNIVTRAFKQCSPKLIDYFRSGWAFFIPYLAAYLLYAWLKWPVNPAPHGGGIAKEISESGAAVSSQWSAVPSLLYVYWFLHSVHLALGIIAFRSWWRARFSDQENNSTCKSGLSAFWPLTPWLLLALTFYIPGIYLEWPSDPWEHLRRINEWRIQDIVTTHSSWLKSSYFLPYSLTGFATGLTQLTWLNFYYTGVCLLLSWQYYRLARAVGLGSRASYLFVLINAITFGNNIFSFYRYYGLSSSIPAQLGAIALTRITLQTLNAQHAETGGPWLASHNLGAGWSLLRSLLVRSPALGALIALTAFNHIQGIGVAGLGVLAVIVWRLIKWKRAMIGWLAFAAIALSVATILWFPRASALDEVYRPQGWLTAWYGFNLFSLSSPAFDRSLQILGAFGVFNLILGLWLIVRRNHVAGWLTLLPALILILPCFALPFVNVLASRVSSYDNILAFHRFLLAMPMGLALVAVCSALPTPAAHRVITANASPSPTLSVPKAYPLLCICLAGALLLFPSSSAYNRLWHGVQVTPDDLQLKHFGAIWTSITSSQPTNDDIPTITLPLGISVRETFSPDTRGGFSRVIHAPPALAELERQLNDIPYLPWLKRSPSTERLLNQPHLPDYCTLTSVLPVAAKMRLVATPTTADSAWRKLGGYGPVPLRLLDGAIVVANPSGRSTHVFNAALIPINHGKRYLLMSALRQSGSLSATNYLAVTWYDKDGKALEANQPLPHGAGSPIGWNNGTYSYYGLFNQPAPANWTTYSISFGLGEPAAIPANAAFMRLGALLNYNNSPDATIQIKDLALHEKPAPTAVHAVLPSPFNLRSPYSLAALLSGHWPPQKVAEEHGGLPELRAAVISHIEP